MGMLMLPRSRDEMTFKFNYFPFSEYMTLNTKTYLWKLLVYSPIAYLLLQVFVKKNKLCIFFSLTLVKFEVYLVCVSSNTKFEQYHVAKMAIV